MSSTGTLATRNAVGATKGQAHRLVAVGAIDDICNRRAPRPLWAHSQTAYLLRVDPEFLVLLQSYLNWRISGIRSDLQQLRIVGEGCTSARLFIACGKGEHLKWEPRDQVALRGKTECERLASLFTQATSRRWGVSSDSATRAERIIAFYCGCTFDELCEAVKATRSATRAAAEVLS
jgi:hypothetical protein